MARPADRSSSGRLSDLPLLHSRLAAPAGAARGAAERSSIPSPTSGTVRPGGTAFATIRVTGATAAVTLTATGAPPGGRVQLLPSTINPGQSSTLFATSGFSTPPGTYKITITATSGTAKGTAEFTLTVAR